MATVTSVGKLCQNCPKTDVTSACAGCDLAFCNRHLSEHRRDLSAQIHEIGQQNLKLKRELIQRRTDTALSTQIKQWETDSVNKIRSIAEKARADLERLNEESKNQLTSSLNKLSDELRSNQEDFGFTEKHLSKWKKQLNELEKDVKTPLEIELLQEDDSSFIRLLKVKANDKKKDDTKESSSPNKSRTEEKRNKVLLRSMSLQDDPSTTQKSELSMKTRPSSSSKSSSYPSLTFGLDQSKHQDIQHLFELLMLLPPMDKNGRMSGKCAPETDQMEKFLSQTFGFKNIPEKYIVQGVKAFQLDKPIHKMDPNTLIQFPYKTADSFDMTASEIVEWQSSYAVYATQQVKKMGDSYLKRALQGGSQDGDEAFFMKFVVRISTCPILMEFDAKIIPRKYTDGWPTRIKLVSVTGIDFAARKHDEGDIRYYVSNWRDIFEVDRGTDKISLRNERDLYQKRDSPVGQLHEDRLLQDLTIMARLRLRACDEEGVQIVVETGIGLGVFSGEQIGIGRKVRFTSALAIRTVLEQDGSSYKNIRAIVFSLPIFNKSRSNQPISDVFHDFVEQFQEPQYNGLIPVLIADQDMHRLTVAIARSGFVVSELNPADSHGVFGEYWQNRGPAVEEKLALTTVGLLVQHHVINPHVLNPNNYHFI